MKLNSHDFSNETNIKTFGRRKKEQAAARIDAEIKSALDELGSNDERRAAFLRLVACVRERTPLLKPALGRGNPGWIAAVFLIKRLQNLASRQAHWTQPCETWRPESGNLRPVFRSLVHHLLTNYPVPGFMDSVWDLPAGAEGFRLQAWYIRGGRGASFRALNLPVVLTRNMEHHVRQSPDHYSVVQSLRNGEVLGLGGNKQLAHEVGIGQLGQKIEHAEFWRTVLGFFVAHPEMNLDHVNPIIDFIQASKFGGEQVLTQNGAATRVAPWPDFSMKGRTLKSILRLARAWHSDLSMNTLGQCFAWRRSDIQGYRFLEGQPGEEAHRDWSIEELLDSSALYAEGRALHHCVYTYTNRCRNGETTIWSLRLRVKDQEKRMATVEVDPRKRSIIQVRAKCNLRPGGRSLEIIRNWATWAGLQLNF